MFIKENLISFKKQLPDYVSLVAVSKTKPVSDIMEAYEAGQRDFGEIRFRKWSINMMSFPKIYSGT